jgi:23S rRNA (adenine2503-C2)-methyltransferase
MSDKKDIRKLDLEAIKAVLVAMNEKPFRAKQVHEWLWKKSVISFSEMTNLSQSTRELLDKDFCINAISTKTKQISTDGTIKFGFSLHDHHVVEGVLIPTDTRMTACISSQVGCSLTCKFCATGYMKRERNLDASEIYDQVVLIAKEAMEQYGKPLTNIVYMGMGEPLLNYNNVLQSVHYLTSPEGLDIASRRITVSTAGIAKMIEKLADDQVKFNLALSLHAANDTKRQEMMPINETNSLKVLANALDYFYAKTKSMLTFEYIVFDGFNDEVADADELVKFVRKVPSKVNIIQYNPIQFVDLVNAKEEKLAKFVSHLEKNNVTVNVRRSRGKDIDAACGQLAVKNKD